MNRPFYIKIDRKSRIPKYKQVMDGIIQGIKDRQLSMGDKILSINALSEQYDLSRDTVEKAYGFLRSQKIIESVKGKGFYVAKTDLAVRANVLFLINKLSTYKMHIFNAFTAAIGKNVKVDLDIYHCEPEMFKSILEKKASEYDYLVIMPHFRNENLKNVGCPDDVLAVLKKIPAEKLILLDKEIKRIPSTVGRVYQDFTDDIYSALKTALPKIKKYRKIILVYPSKALYPYPQEIVIGFRRFCAKTQLDCEILDEIFDSMELQQKDLYIIIQESDLVNLVKQVRDKHYQLGKDIGIICYNDTPLKELLGITVISTDFKQMGTLAAQMIMDKKISSIKNDFNFIDRNSA
ncbi:MAG: GntR family transcriptional regulator [Bacteroidota bacterium]